MLTNQNRFQQNPEESNKRILSATDDEKIRISQFHPLKKPISNFIYKNMKTNHNRIFDFGESEDFRLLEMFDVSPSYLYKYINVEELSNICQTWMQLTKNKPENSELYYYGSNFTKENDKKNPIVQMKERTPSKWRNIAIFFKNNINRVKRTDTCSDTCDEGIDPGSNVSNSVNSLVSKTEHARDWITLYFQMPDKTQMRFEMKKTCLFRFAMEAFCARLGIRNVNLIAFIRPPEFEVHLYDTPIDLEMHPGEIILVLPREQ